MNGKKDRFELEELIQSCWQTKDDIDNLMYFLTKEYKGLTRERRMESIEYYYQYFSELLSLYHLKMAICLIRRHHYYFYPYLNFHG